MTPEELQQVHRALQGALPVLRRWKRKYYTARIDLYDAISIVARYLPIEESQSETKEQA